MAKQTAAAKPQKEIGTLVVKLVRDERTFFQVQQFSLEKGFLSVTDRHGDLYNINVQTIVEWVVRKSDKQMDEMIRENGLNRKIQSIKRVRELTGMGLKDAKEYVERVLG